MKRTFILFSILLAFVIFVGCISKQRYHETELPDPKSFNAHFPDLDTSGDDFVSWQEFKDYFPQAELEVFRALDLNGDELVDHDEWHKFKEAHGLKHMD